MDESDGWDDARGSGDGRYADKYGGGGWDDARGSGDRRYAGKYGGVGGMILGAVGMYGTPPNMAGGGSMQHRSPRTPTESVYRPYIDLLADDSPSTVPETQYAGIETFSFEQLGQELGLSPIRETPDEAEPVARQEQRQGQVQGRG